MKQSDYLIRSNERLTDTVCRMTLKGDTSAITAPGQFVNIKIDGQYLRRPISVCDWNENELTLLYKIVGEGTDRMSRMAAGTSLDMLTGLGNGFDLTKSGSNPVLIGGGVGIPPLYALCKALLRDSKMPSVILGFNHKDEMFYTCEFAALGVPVSVTTVDGSAGYRGYVTDVLKDMTYSYFYTCGPRPMYLAIDRIASSSGQFSFEEHMGCGFGACMGCTCKTKYGNKRICKDGPVLEREEIVW